MQVDCYPAVVVVVGRELCAALCTALVVFALCGLCRGDSDNSLRLPPLLLPTLSQHMSQLQVASLRRQLMRDNYDYQHSDDEPNKQNVTETSVVHPAKFNLQRPSDLHQTNIDSFSAEQDQQDQYEHQDLQYQQRGKHDQPGKYKQHRQRGQGRPHEQLANSENRGQSKQPAEHEQTNQYEQQGLLKQQHKLQHRGQNEPPEKYKYRYQYKRASEHGHPVQTKQRAQHVQNQHQQLLQHKQREKLRQRGQLERRNQDVQHGLHKKRGQNEQGRRYLDLGMYAEHQHDQHELSEPREQFSQFDEQERSIQQTHRAAPPLADAPTAPSNEVTERNVHEREYPPARHATRSDWPVKYYNKQRNMYDPAPMHRRPFGDLRGDKEPIPRGQQEYEPENDAHSLEQELSLDEREAFERQMSSSENEGSDISESQKQPQGRQYTRSTRANRLQYYTPAPSLMRKRRPWPRDHIPLTYSDYHSPLQYDHNVPQEPQRNAPPYRHRNSPQDSIPQKDLQYYTDENKARRHINHMSLDVSDENQSTGFEPLSPRPIGDSLYSTTSIQPNLNDSRHSTTSTPPSPVGIRHSLVSQAKPIGPRVHPASPQASRRFSPVVSRASPTSTHKESPSHPGTTGPPDLSRTKRVRSFVVTVSANNVTYKLLTLKSREGRRQAERRLLEERGPDGVAIMSLDHAPLPAFRLPRARRQYMHDHHHHRDKP